MITVKEAAERLRLCRLTVKEAIKAGDIKAVKLGKRYWIPEAEIERITEANRKVCENAA